jgi:hypothetical protein
LYSCTKRLYLEDFSFLLEKFSRHLEHSLENRLRKNGISREMISRMLKEIINQLE